ncbi:hypothetical protein PENTCL1PPCAC_27616, partial [Pristionchus entomophagus]
IPSTRLEWFLPSFSSSKMCCCCGCCVNKEPISKKAPPNLADSGKDGTSSKASVTQQPGGSKASKPVAGSIEQKTKKHSDCANYENVSIMK